MGLAGIRVIVPDPTPFVLEDNDFALFGDVSECEVRSTSPGLEFGRV